MEMLREHLRGLLAFSTSSAATGRTWCFKESIIREILISEAVLSSVTVFNSFLLFHVQSSVNKGYLISYKTKATIVLWAVSRLETMS